jgi:competence protein ComEC
MLRILIPFFTGIAMGLYLDAPCVNPIPFLLILLIILVFAMFSPWWFPGYSRRWFSGTWIFVFLFLSGLVIQQTFHPGSRAVQFRPDQEYIFLAQVSEFPSQTSSGLRTIISTSHQWRDGKWVPVGFQALAYIIRKKEHELPMFGDWLIFKAIPVKIEDNSNPNAFNYARYLYRKGVLFKFRIDSYKWEKSHYQAAIGIRAFAFRARDYLLEVLKKNDVAGDEFAVAAALLLGYTGDLNRELLSDYAATGAMHVLSVSGMHVGVIWLFFEFLLSFLNRTRWTRWLKAVLILVLIWFYSFMTGMAPCILRSAIMITLPILAKTLERSSHMYNVIAASLVIMLALDPYVLQDIGFQLSYLAVVGLVVLYKPIYDLYITSLWIPDKIWSLWAVSIAAQLATLPLTLYVFHQFPNYFLLTNLFVVPLSSLVIYTGIMLMVLSPLTCLAGLIAKLLVLFIWLLNTVIHWIEGLPGSVWDGIFLRSYQLLLFSLLLILGVIWLHHRRRVVLHILLCVAMLMAGSGLYHQIRIGENRSFTVFNVKGGVLIHFYYENRALVFYGTGYPDERQFIQQIRKLSTDNLAANDIRFSREYRISALYRDLFTTKGFVPCEGRSGIIQLSGTRIVLVNKALVSGSNANLKSDVVILSGNPKVGLAVVKQMFQPDVVIADGTNSRSRVVAWKRESGKFGLRFHAVSELGAYHQ